MGWIVNDEYIGICQEAFHDPGGRGVFEVQCETPFVAVRQLPEIIPFSSWVWFDGVEKAMWVSPTGGFDLDHFGAEIGKDGTGCGSGDKTCAVDHFEAAKNSLAHILLFVLFVVQLCNGVLCVSRCSILSCVAAVPSR